MKPSTPASSAKPAAAERASWVWGILALIATVMLAQFYLNVFQPQTYYRSEDTKPAYDGAAMAAAVDPAQVQKRQAELMQFGSRFLGEPGTQQTGAYIEDAFRKAGLEVVEHQVTTASPLTDYREIYHQVSDPAGSAPHEKKMADVEVYPFLPNHLQPVSTGDAGVTGRLVLATRDLLEKGTRFDDQIALIDAKAGVYDSDYGFNWVRYARAGFKAVIVSDSNGWADIAWSRIAGRTPGQTSMVSSSPLNFVRLAATPEIFKHVGETIRLRVKVKFVAAPNTTYYGVFHAKNPTRQAICLLMPYDVPSVLPDSAVSPLATISPAFALQFLDGLKSYGDTLQRDVIFVAYGSSMMGEDGINHLARILQANTRLAQENPLLRALGIKTAPAENKRVQHLQDNQRENRKAMASVDQAAALFDQQLFMTDPAATTKVVADLTESGKRVLADQFSYVMDSLVVELSEPVLQRKLDFLRAGQDTHGPAFAAYLAAKEDLDAVSGYAGYSIQGLLRDNPSLLQRFGLRDRLHARLADLLAYHQRVDRQLEQEQDLARLFNRYEDVSFFASRLVPAFAAGDARESVILQVGQDAKTTPRAAGVFNIFVNASHHLAPASPEVHVVTPDQPNYAMPAENFVSQSITEVLDQWGYSTYTLYSYTRDQSFADYPDPVVKPYMLDLSGLRGSFDLYSRALLAFAHGEGPVAPSTVREWLYLSFGGQVLVSGVGQSVVPHHPLAGAAIANRPMENEEIYSEPGRYECPIVMADPYGKYRLEFNSNDFPSWWRVFTHGGDYSPIAAGYDDDGMIKFIKDEGEDGQRLFKSLNINIHTPARENTTIVTFRASPISVLDLTNPQTMKDYSYPDYVTADGLSDFSKIFYMSGPGIDTTYLEPDRRTYILLESGAPGNDLVQETRAFLLGIPDPFNFKMTRDIDGPGYLVADHRFVRDVPIEAARSMAAVNGNRLELQKSYHMDDEQTETYQQKTWDNLKLAAHPDQPLQEATHSARDALTYAMLNHPVIRQKVIEAVISILWYLALLVPFVFFFEKLAFGFADVRWQIAAQVSIFLGVFALLWILHPAFAMVRSSLMILLGFIIILISGGITLLFSSKFQENLEDLRKRRGKVTGAEVNTMGVIGAAFLLGLNNLHRRRVRTGLTCATLTLLTFVMISFTSVQNSIVEEDIAIGKAPYQGMLVKKEHFEPISDAEVFAFHAKYGQQYDVCLRRFGRGTRDWNTNKRHNPQSTLTFTDAAGVPHNYIFNSVLQLAPEEPLRDKITLLGGATWFKPEQAQEGAGVVPIFIPDKAASSVGISPEMIAATGGVPVRMNGRDFKVIGIFTANSLNQLRDLDGLDLLPFNIEKVLDLVQGAKDRNLTAKDDAPRIPAEELFISPLRDVGITPEKMMNSSLAIGMPKAGYKAASQEIVSFMEQTGQPIFYGLDGVAYKGKRTREVTLAGLVDLIIPLLIAGLTVLNTMRGSVYERRDEIFVYNAVGIAPRYVFFMFMAEALVYAVVGSVLGYLLSQGVGRILTELGWTGGLNMTYTSLSTIYASLTIMLAVFVSTYFPARSAMEIAKPADEAGWNLPEPNGDELAFDLPFNFLARGRMAILVFFDRYLLDHAEGGMGTFSSSTPKLAVERIDSDEPVPCLKATVWLKPFDLAVSQQIVISMPRDEETGQFKARITITRLSGTRESWLRLNRNFVSLVRRHFLYWRAVGPVEQEEMYREAKAKFERDVYAPEPALVSA